MPGSSLWLTPPPSHPVYAILTKLIESTVPSHCADATTTRPPIFSPHLTLTSNIDPAVYGSDPQRWLDSLPFPSRSGVHVRFERVKTEDVYYRRCYIKCELEGVADIAAVARARGVEGEDAVGGEKTQNWLNEWKQSFGPHVSLLYGDIPIPDAKLNLVEKAVLEEGILLKTITGSDGIEGWEGGTVWLVPTDRDITEWKPIATKIL